MKRNENRAVDRWSVPVEVDDLPDTGGHYELSADAQARSDDDGTFSLPLTPTSTVDAYVTVAGDPSETPT